MLSGTWEDEGPGWKQAPLAAFAQTWQSCGWTRPFPAWLSRGIEPPQPWHDPTRGPTHSALTAGSRSPFWGAGREPCSPVLHLET